LNNTTGSNNIALGVSAGTNLTTGSNKIDIGALGAGGESNTIRLGKAGVQTVSAANPNSRFGGCRYLSF
jgi:hypothetical protein